MRLAIDWDLCIGSGLCREASDGAFGLAPFGGAERRAILVDPTKGDEALLAAAYACPTLAIRVWLHGVPLDPAAPRTSGGAAKPPPSSR
jgi:ferredoxin